MCLELINTIISALGIILGVFVAYHVYALSKQQTFRERFARREAIQKQVEELLYKIRNGNTSKVELINVAKYDKHYPLNNEKSHRGYTYLGAELKGYHFAGVEFFCEIISAYKKEDGKFSKKQIGNQGATNVFVTGVVPYEWIESVDLRGDDTSYRPQFYTHFKGKDNYPYKTIRHYTKKEDGSDGFIEVSLI
jgi:hypothetical protein